MIIYGEKKYFMVIKYCLIFLLFVSCQGNERVAKIDKLRYYQVYDAIPTDSIWYDTIFVPKRKSKNDLNNLINSIDSVFTYEKKIKKFDLERAKISLLDTLVIMLPTKSHVLKRYIVEVPIEYGSLSYFGIYMESTGTIFWKWLDGTKELRLFKEERRTDGNVMIYKDIFAYLDTTVLKIPSKPDDALKIEKEINEVIEVDTTFF